MLFVRNAALLSSLGYMQPDVIVVGAGSSGCVIARRVTERSDHALLLLEAGPDYHGLPQPLDLSDARRNSMNAHDWGYRHKPNANHLYRTARSAR
jgi:choline dehydrogenase